MINKMIGTWRMEDLERSLLTGLRPGKGCGESFVLQVTKFKRPSQAMWCCWSRGDFFNLLPARSPGAVACKLLAPPQAARLPPPHFESRLNNDILLPLTIPSTPPTFFFLGISICLNFLVAVLLLRLYNVHVQLRFLKRQWGWRKMLLECAEADPVPDFYSFCAFYPSLAFCSVRPLATKVKIIFDFS